MMTDKLPMLETEDQALCHSAERTSRSGEGLLWRAVPGGASDLNLDHLERNKSGIRSLALVVGHRRKEI